MPPAAHKAPRQLDDAVEQAAESVFSQLRTLGLVKTREEHTLLAIAGALWTHRGGGASQRDAAEKFGVSRNQVVAMRWHMWTLVDSGGTLPVDVFDKSLDDFVRTRQPLPELKPPAEPMLASLVTDFRGTVQTLLRKTAGRSAKERSALCTPELLGKCTELLALRDERLREDAALAKDVLRLLRSLCTGARDAQSAMLEASVLDAVAAVLFWARAQPLRAETDEDSAEIARLCASLLGAAAQGHAGAQEWVWARLVPNNVCVLMGDADPAVRSSACMLLFACVSDDDARMNALAGSALVLRRVINGAQSADAQAAAAGEAAPFCWPRALLALVLRKGLGSTALRTLRAAAPAEVQAARSAATPPSPDAPSVFGAVRLLEAIEAMTTAKAEAHRRQQLSAAVVGELSAECSALCSTVSQWEPQRYAESAAAGRSALRAEPLLMLQAFARTLGTAVATGEHGADTSARAHGLVTRVGAMLAKLVAWDPPSLHPPEGADTSAAVGLKASLARLVSALCYWDEHARSEVRREPVLRPLLACCVEDPRDPGLREAALLALFKALRGHPELEIMVSAEVQRQVAGSSVPEEAAEEGGQAVGVAQGRAARREAARLVHEAAIREAEAEVRAAEEAAAAAEAKLAALAKAQSAAEEVRSAVEAALEKRAEAVGLAWESLAKDVIGGAGGKGSTLGAGTGAYDLEAVAAELRALDAAAHGE